MSARAQETTTKRVKGKPPTIGRSKTAANRDNGKKLEGYVKPLLLSDFDRTKILGKGGFGEIHLATYKFRRYRATVAIKTIRQKALEECKMEHQIERELRTNWNIRHPNVCCFFAYVEAKNLVYIVMEYCEGGDLHTKRESYPNRRIPEKEAAGYVLDITRGLRHIHAKGLLHRDMKAENVILDKHGRAKICDFGWAVKNETGLHDTKCGTIDFMSPEVAFNEFYSFDADLWSLGVLIYELLTGETPFGIIEGGEMEMDKYKELVAARIQKGEYTWPKDAFVSFEARDLVDGLLQLNPDNRLPLGCVLVHPWIVRHAGNDSLCGPR